jgi:hypothetical protein
LCDLILQLIKSGVRLRYYQLVAAAGLSTCHKTMHSFQSASHLDVIVQACKLIMLLLTRNMHRYFVFSTCL